MGAQKSIHAGNAKIDFNVDFTNKLCSNLMFDPFRNAGEESPLSLVIGSLCIKHPNLFGKSEKLVFLWDKGLCDSNIMITYRKPKPACLSQHAFTIQHSISPELGIHGIPVDNFSRSGGGGVSLSRTSIGVDLSELLTSNLSSNTSAKFEHVRPINDDGRSISRDIHGFPVTCSGGFHDNMLVLKQEFCYTMENNRSFTRVNEEIAVEIAAARAHTCRRKFTAAGSNSRVRGRGSFIFRLVNAVDFAVTSAFWIGQVCSIPRRFDLRYQITHLIKHHLLSCVQNPMLKGAVFLDWGSDMSSGRHVPGNPALRHGKPGSGFGFGYGLRFKSPLGHVQVDYAFNAIQQRTVYFGFSNMS
ncbi:Outer membrane OMP85 family protein [Striga hermonthica]|uniref:Outer membrane OMP85 family protein n=1 Tax=Striga hermonthica TaxID=68872 RepID=A0A9N7NZG3_STRHE|nr:Outer membrane OMP85 family protein [Striga hermonthica]